MKRLLLLIIAASISVSGSLSAEETASSVCERYLHSGKFSDGETALMLAIDENPEDDEARFGLGVMQFMRAVENLGQSLYDYGAVSEKANQPFLRLPVPKNEEPSTISYHSLGRVLDVFAADLERAEATLAEIKDDDVKLKLRLAKISFDFDRTGENNTTLFDIIEKINGGRMSFQDADPEFRVHFDRGDVAWLRAYCHLLSAMVEGYRAVDEEIGFERRVSHIFPKIEPSKRPVEDEVDFWQYIGVVDKPRLRRMRLHLLAVCELNRETWTKYRSEEDDDFEWLPNAKQTDMLGLPLTDEQIDRWLAMMQEMEWMLKGESLLPLWITKFLDDTIEGDVGLSVKRVLDDPPGDFLNFERIQKEGLDRKYIESTESKKEMNLGRIFEGFQLLNGPFGFAYGLRLN